MASHAHIGDGSARTIEFEVQLCLAAALTTTTNDLLTIAERAQHLSFWSKQICQCSLHQ